MKEWIIPDEFLDYETKMSADGQGYLTELVRCTDCKHNDGSCCDYSAVWVRPNGYCQWGERKEKEDG